MNKRDAILSLCLGKVLSTKHDDITSLYYMTSQGDIYKAKRMVWYLSRLIPIIFLLSWI